jgi:hypothetical protein
MLTHQASCALLRRADTGKAKIDPVDLEALKRFKVTKNRPGRGQEGQEDE